MYITQLENNIIQLSEKLGEMDINRNEWVPKKYISSYLVNYYNIENTPKTKTEMLNTLAKLLDFSSEDKKKIGLN